MKTLLLVTLFLPAAAAILTGFGRMQARCLALVASLATLVGAVMLVAGFPIGAKDFAGTHWHWFAALDKSLDIQFSVGLDGLSLWLFALTALLLVVAVLVSWEAIKDQESLYYRFLLLLGTGMLGVFVARDIILFYLFFEFTLVPLFFLIGIWGSEQRRYAAIKFFLFTLAGSVLTLLGLVTIVLWDSSSGGHPMTFSIPDLTANLQAHPLPYAMQVWIFLALFAGFAIKVPLFPLHTWLPLAHVEAPAAGSILLAGVLLKIGTYGFLRFSLPMLPEAAVACMPWMLWLSVAGILYGALVALAQTDLKRLIAYSSVSHLGFCMLGIFALNRVALQGGVLQMINHGLSTGGLFAIVGMLYQRYHTRRIADFGGIAREVPVLAFFMLFMTLASIGLPGLNGFVGEFLLLMGMFQRAWGTVATEWTAQYRVISVLAVSGVVLGAWYMLSLVARVFFGPLRERKQAEPITDLTLREIAALVPLCLIIVWIGVQPKFFLDRMAPAIDQLTSQAMQKLTQRRKGANEQRNEGMEDGKMGERKMNQEKGVRNEMPKLSSCLPLNFSASVHFSFPHIPFSSSSLALCAFAPLRENPIGQFSHRQPPFLDDILKPAMEIARVP